MTTDSLTLVSRSGGVCDLGNSFGTARPSRNDRSDDDAIPNSCPPDLDDEVTDSTDGNVNGSLLTVSSLSVSEKIPTSGESVTLHKTDNRSLEYTEFFQYGLLHFFCFASNLAYITGMIFEKTS